jgi:hypothetical protein
MLFKGRSCYPLSPDKKNGEDDESATVGKNDLLIKILSKLKNLEETDKSFISNHEALNYLETIEGQCFKKINSLD